MRYLVYILIVCSLIGTNFFVSTGITWGDIFCAILLLISILNLIQRRWIIDRFCKLSALYLPCMLIAAIINGEVTNTIFINYFRNYFWGVLAYLSLSNSINSIKDIRRCLVVSIAYLVYFLFNFRVLMQNSSYDTINTLDFGYGRNNVAFTSLLIAVFLEFLYYSKLARAYILLGVVLMAIIILFCASRYAMIMLVISFLIFRVSSKQRINLTEVTSFAVLAVIGFFIYNFVIGFIDTSFYEYSQTYLTEKLSDARADFWQTRVMAINVKPITEMLSSGNYLFLLFGSPIAVQHSFLSHTLITTGVVGCLCYLISHIRLLVWIYKFKGVFLFLFIIVMVMFVNDFITNARFYVGVNSILYGAICAIIFKYIRIIGNTSLS